MASPDKRKKEEPQAILRMKKELEKKQEALRTSDRSKSQMKK